MFKNKIFKELKPKLADYARSSKFTLDTLKGTQHLEAYKIFYETVNLFAYNFAKKYVKQGTHATKREAELIVEKDIREWAKTYFRAKDKFRIPFEAIR